MRLHGVVSRQIHPQLVEVRCLGACVACSAAVAASLIERVGPFCTRLSTTPQKRQNSGDEDAAADMNLFDALRELSTLSEKRVSQLAHEKELDAAIAAKCGGRCDETAARFMLLCRRLNREHCESIRRNSQLGNPFKYTGLIRDNMAQVRRLLNEAGTALETDEPCDALAQLLLRDDWKCFTLTAQASAPALR